jgi:hypothetical protein
MNGFFLIPVIIALLDGGLTSTYPKYLRSFRNPTGYACRFSSSRYGRQDMWLIRVMDISAEVYAALAAQPDVYAFPADTNLDSPITDKAVIDSFFEGFNIPTDWTTPSTTYRELLRTLANMALMLQRYYGIAGEELFVSGVTLDTRVRDLSTLAQNSLQQTVNSFGYSIPINQNATLRQLLKTAADVLQSTPVKLGDFQL